MGLGEYTKIVDMSRERNVVVAENVDMGPRGHTGRMCKCMHHEDSEF